MPTIANHKKQRLMGMSLIAQLLYPETNDWSNTNIDLMVAQHEKSETHHSQQDSSSCDHAFLYGCVLPHKFHVGDTWLT